MNKQQIQETIDSLFDYGDLAGTLAWVNQQLQQYPDHSYLLKLKGNLLLLLHKPFLAKLAFRRLIRTAPDCAWGYTGMAQVLMCISQYEKALEYLEKAIVLDPADAVAWNSSAVCYFRLDRHEDALVAVESVLHLDFDLFNCNMMKSAVLVELGRSREAFAVIDKMIELERDAQNLLVVHLYRAQLRHKLFSPCLPEDLLRSVLSDIQYCSLQIDSLTTMRESGIDYAKSIDPDDMLSTIEEVHFLINSLIEEYGKARIYRLAGWTIA